MKRDKYAPKILRDNHKLPDGRYLSIFLNEETMLFVVDVVEKDETGGNEIVRKTLPPPLSDEDRAALAAMGEPEEEP